MSQTHAFNLQQQRIKELTTFATDYILASEFRALLHDCIVLKLNLKNAQTHPGWKALELEYYTQVNSEPNAERYILKHIKSHLHSEDLERLHPSLKIV